MRTTSEHVIFGTGAIGLVTLDALRRRGASVRMVNRSGVAAVPADVEEATPLDQALAATVTTYRNATTNPAGRR